MKYNLENQKTLDKKTGHLSKYTSNNIIITCNDYMKVLNIKLFVIKKKKIKKTLHVYDWLTKIVTSIYKNAKDK